MITRDFKGIPSIQEVECWGGHLEQDIAIVTLKLYRVADSFLLAYLNPYAQKCLTFGEFASCVINPEDTRMSKVRVLISDLEEDEIRQYGCNATTFKSVEDAKTMDWIITVQRRSEYTGEQFCLGFYELIHSLEFEVSWITSHFLTNTGYSPIIFYLV